MKLHLFTTALLFAVEVYATQPLFCDYGYNGVASCDTGTFAFCVSFAFYYFAFFILSLNCINARRGRHQRKSS
jgi:hypothetical protein